MRSPFLSQECAVASSKSTRSPLSLQLRVGVIAAMLVVTASVSLAQSLSSSSSDIKYSFTLDPNSVSLASNLTVNNGGLIQYNLIDSTVSGPYTAMTGSGSASASIDPVTQYNNSTWSGENKINSSASSGPNGTGSASVGSQENLFLTNSGSSTISLDISALVQVNTSVSTTGPTTASNFAQLSTYAGIYDYDITTMNAISNPLVHPSGDAGTGVNTALTGNWTTETIGGQTYYQDSYVMNLAPGEEHLLEFYASSKNLSGGTPVTPEPAAFLSLFAGLIGIAAFRRKSLARSS